jgi:branched-chain amino acid transport system substrate-binding protein
MFPKVGGEIVDRDAFLNGDASIASQITRIKNWSEEPDVIMLCSYISGAESAVRQIWAAGIVSTILNRLAVDGYFCLSAAPDLSNFIVPVQGSIYGNDTRLGVAEFRDAFKAVNTGPSSTYVCLATCWPAFGPRRFLDQLHHQNTVEVALFLTTSALKVS